MSEFVLNTNGRENETIESPAQEDQTKGGNRLGTDGNTAAGAVTAGTTLEEVDVNTSANSTAQPSAGSGADDLGGGGDKNVVVEVEVEVEEDSPSLAELKRRFAEKQFPVQLTPTTFKRYLVGRKGSVEDALAALCKYAAWRIENKADTLTAEDCGAYYRKRVSFLHGRDRNGRPVVCTIAGRHDAYDRDVNEVKNMCIHLLDGALALAKPEEERILSVFDLTAFHMRCMDYVSAKIFVDMLQGYYPEILGNLILVNAPLIFYACWAIIRVWLDPVTAAKIVFISMDDIHKYIDADQLSPELGSTERD